MRIPQLYSPNGKSVNFIQINSARKWPLKFNPLSSVHPPRLLLPLGCRVIDVSIVSTMNILIDNILIKYNGPRTDTIFHRFKSKHSYHTRPHNGCRFISSAPNTHCTSHPLCCSIVIVDQRLNQLQSTMRGIHYYHHYHFIISYCALHKN